MSFLVTLHMFTARLPAESAGLIVRSAWSTPDVVGRFEFDDCDEVLMRLGKFVPSRMVEAVVHGLDLTDALGRIPSPRRRGWR